MYCTKPVTRTASREHQCTYCGESIAAGEKYETWRSVDDAWFTNKMHPECCNDLNEWGDGEYFPFSNDRPKETK